MAKRTKRRRRERCRKRRQEKRLQVAQHEARLRARNVVETYEPQVYVGAINGSVVRDATESTETFAAAAMPLHEEAD